MLIPGLPNVGAQQDVIKPKRQVQPTAETGPTREAVDDKYLERRQRDIGHLPERRRSRRRRLGEADAESGAATVEPVELPSKGLLIDIEV
ncbi:hypothetical protein BVH74_10275 [Halopseudomonas phragmitis]|uniref:Aspartate-semialdehyde dehydrogenase n=2 Tax=Pseudomonadaceae TaxID=135621 RepID=A0A1V0B5A0_9GAMM|nr:hypothetical protein [Pseudomonas jilinensis]AQZ95108.1 hypothetical protein BVH74_10275 [Halopseudomonas phragmitis]RHW21948.1 hypothetical protein C2846_05670 [Pseudomonas jilinensis]